MLYSYIKLVVTVYVWNVSTSLFITVITSITCIISIVQVKLNDCVMTLYITHITL